MPIDPNQDRSKLIGGSEIAAIMSMSRWSTPLEIWAKKTGNIPSETEMNGPMELGILLEPFVATLFEKKSGKKVKLDGRDFRHPKYPYLVSHIDYWVVGEDGADLEIKTCSAYGFKDWEEDIPQECELQKNWSSGIVGLHRGKPPKDGYVAVLVGGQIFNWKPFKFNQELFDKQVEIAVDFWERFVLTEMPPFAISGDKDTLTELYPESNAGQVLKLGDDPDLETMFNQLAVDRMEGKAQIKEIDIEVDDADNKLRQLIGEHESVESGLYKASWKPQNSTKLNIVKMKEDGVYERYAVTKIIKVLRVTEKSFKDKSK